VQVAVLPIAESHQSRGQAVVDALLAAGLRVENDASNNTLNYRIRGAQKMKIPFMVILGDKEVESGGLTVRLRTGDNMEFASIDDFVSFAYKKVEERVSI